MMASRLFLRTRHPSQRNLRLIGLLLSIISSASLAFSQHESWGNNACPPWDQNPSCPCFYIDDRLFLECPMVSLRVIADVLRLIHKPIKSFSIYDLSSNTTALPDHVFNQSIIHNLQISHSNIKSIEGRGFFGLEDSLERLEILHSELEQVPKEALRKLNVLEVLSLQANHINEIDNRSFFGMKIKDLNLMGNGLESISKDAFAGLENSLEELNLMNNRLNVLNLSALKNLDKLHTLHVTWNQIEKIIIEEGIPALPSLRHLDLGSNHFTTLSTNNFSIFPSLTFLSLNLNEIETVEDVVNLELEGIDLSHNFIEKLPASAFHSALSIASIDISNNRLRSVDNGVFANLHNLTELSINHNRLQSVSEEAFESAQALKSLKLNDNSIKILENGCFRSMKGLQDLDLENNFLVELPPEIFEENSHLIHLNLAKNFIARINRKTFRNLHALQLLNLQNNKIVKIGNGIFASLFTVQTIYLQHNRIDYISGNAFLSLKELSYLDLSHNRIKGLPHAFDKKSGNLQKLILSYNQLHTIHRKTFQGQNKMEDLRLDHNRLTTIDDSLLSNLIALRELHLENNLIRQIHPKAFESLKNLEVMSLSDNRLTVIEENLLKNLEYLRDLDLSNNHIGSVDPKAFSGLTSINIISLSGNRLNEIDHKVFVGDIPVTALFLKDCNISKIAKDAFYSLPFLENLDLSGNKLTTLSHSYLASESLRTLSLARNTFSTIKIKAFSKSGNLQTVDLHACELEEIPDSLFSDSNLRNINLASNRLRNITEGTLDGLRYLKEIDLSDNRLTSITPLTHLRNLEKLRVGNNPLENFDENLSRLEHLRELNMSGALINNINKNELRNLQSIKVLDISHNNLEDIPKGALTDLPLISLNLGFNSFQSIPSSLFFDRLPYLRVLDISGNPLSVLTTSEIPDSFHIRNLEELIASYTNLTHIQGNDFKLTPMLKRLKLAHNQITRIEPDAFDSLGLLSHLDLSMNQIEEFPKELLRGMDSLTVLNLTRNNIKSFDRFLDYAVSLTVLDISSNLWTEVSSSTLGHSFSLESLLLRDNWVAILDPQAFQGTPRLSHLDLTHNFLHNFDPVVLNPIEKTLRTLNLDGKDWDCSCGSTELWAWLQENLHLLDSHSLTCGSPNTLQNSSLLRLTTSQLCNERSVTDITATAEESVDGDSVYNVTWRNAEGAVGALPFAYRVTHEPEDAPKVTDPDEVAQLVPRGSDSTTLRVRDEKGGGSSLRICVQPLTSVMQYAEETAKAARHVKDRTCTLVERISSSTSAPSSPATASVDYLPIILGIVLGLALVVSLVAACLCLRAHVNSRRRAKEQRRMASKTNNRAPPAYTITQSFYPHCNGKDDNYAL
ncbi:uncharacterized protein LOC143035892 [Oratosquilla oratoria]|uniref:uncharacterized protein LOC143035892 n=1 Tax=Oratosquilla oratoria TaxID=337810 RepID=UPI003F7658EA